nr:hypothetical protein [Tanacetum cinerariifolium]
MKSSDFSVGPSDGVNKNKAGTSKCVSVKRRRTSEKDNAKSLVLETRSSPRTFYNSISTLKPNQKACLEQIGFGYFVEFKVDGIPSKLGLYVVDKFDAKKMENKLAEGALKITKNLISDMLGIRNEGIDIMAEEGIRMRKCKCSSFNVLRKRQPTLVWTSELLREREDKELNYGGFGFGEIEGLFVEQEGPMPDNIEGFFWKLNKHINPIIKEKTGFEKTLDAAEYMFPGKLEGFFERYVDALKYQGCRKEGSGNANISDANRAADAQADGQNNKGASFVSVQAMIGEHVISLRDEHVDICMDQEDEDVVTPEANTQEPNLASEISIPLPLRPIPSVCPLGTAVGRLRRDKDKRPVTISKVRKSPFIGRVVDADGSLNAMGKRVTKYLFEVLEDHRSKESPFRMFLPTFVVGREGRFQSFMGYVVNAIENKEKCELLKDIDVVSSILHFFITLIDNGGHKFLFVADLKNSRPLLIDHEKNEKIVRKRVKKKIRTCDNITVAAMLQEDFGQYLMLKNHSKAGNFIGSETEVGESD